MQETPETWVWSLDWEDPLEKGMANHSSILAWKIPWAEEPSGLWPGGHRELDKTKHTCTLPLLKKFFSSCFMEVLELFFFYKVSMGCFYLLSHGLSCSHTSQSSIFFFFLSHPDNTLSFFVFVLLGFNWPIVPILSFCLLQPVIDGYWNKSTFFVNWGPGGNPKTVGHYLGTWRGQLEPVPSRDNKPKHWEERGDCREQCLWEWRGVENMEDLKEKVEFEAFDAPWTVAPPGSSVHGILQARILEWVAIPFSRGSSW